MNDYPELFLCKKCKEYKPIGELVEVRVRDLMFPVNFCKKCIGEINKNPEEIKKCE